MMMDVLSVRNVFKTLKYSTLFLVLIIFLFACKPNNPQLDEFAQCLTEQGAVMYGSLGCSHCERNKAMFGSSVKFITYVECNPRGDNAQPELCISKNITGYPTWEFADGSIAVGEQTLYDLNQKTGCVING